MMPWRTVSLTSASTFTQPALVKTRCIAASEPRMRKLTMSPVLPSLSLMRLAIFENRLLSKIARRISDKEGNTGDMVNFLILGSEAAMQRVFTNAGWVKVDADVRDTVLHGIIGS